MLPLLSCSSKTLPPYIPGVTDTYRKNLIFASLQSKDLLLKLTSDEMDEVVHKSHVTRPLLYEPFHTDQLKFSPYKHTDDVIHDILNSPTTA